MQRRSGLGRGLDALIPSQDADPPDGAAPPLSPATPGPESALRDVPIDAIHSNRYQPRQQFADADMAELTDSVRELGVLQPLLVRADPAGGFELIAGERRWRAARAAGLTTVPAVVRDVEDRHALEQALVENLQRSDLNALEEALAYQQLADLFALTQEAVAGRVGKSRSAVTNTLRLLQLTPAVQDMVREGALSAGHARALVAVDDPATQLRLATRAATEAWSVRQIEREAKKAASGGAPTPKSPRGNTRSAAVLELEGLLADHLDTRVEVKLASPTGKGKIVVEFAGVDDLERIYRAMSTGRETE